MMGPTIAIILVLVIVAIIIVVASGESKRKKNKANVEQRIKEICLNARIVVNTGKYVFFVNDEAQTFGFDTSGNMYRLSGIRSIFTYQFGIAINHDDLKRSIELGKVYNSPLPLAPSDVKAIETEALASLRKRLAATLKQYGVTSTHEYIHDGTIWGCDINSAQFYTTYSTPEIKPFSDLLGVTIEDTSSNTYQESNYIIHVKTKDETLPEGFEYDIYFKAKDETFNNLLAMFKGIRNRQKATPGVRKTSYTYSTTESNRYASDIVRSLHKIVVEHDAISETKLGNILSLYLSSVAKYIADRTTGIRREKAEVFDYCLEQMKFNDGFEMTGKMLYIDTPPEDGLQVIGAMEGIVTGFPKMAALLIEKEKGSQFALLTIDLFDTLEQKVRNRFNRITV